MDMTCDQRALEGRVAKREKSESIIDKLSVDAFISARILRRLTVKNEGTEVVEGRDDSLNDSPRKGGAFESYCWNTSLELIVITI